MKQVIGQFQDMDQAARAVHELKPLFENRITIVRRGPEPDQDADTLLNNDVSITAAAFGIGAAVIPVTGAGFSESPVSNAINNIGVQDSIETGGETYIQEEAANEEEAIRARYTSTLVIVDTNDIDKGEAKRILQAHGGTLLSPAKAAALGHDDPFVTADPIEPFSPRGYIDPNIGLGNFGIVDPMKR
ncbi:hypothetical protein [Effusibacillus consociatus]|uniref:Uncharacterized protein n=1 Tax=Effusibacillus consociatus TaxID=1117041 RepID=A0ABV9Q8V3_9BACL